MTVLDSLAIALTALRANLMRSVLTTLGIIIGVASVVVLVAVGTGASSDVNRKINALGTNMLVISSGTRNVGGRSSGAGTDVPLAEGDIRAIREKINGVTAISGLLSGSAAVTYGSANWVTSASGVHADYPTVRDWPVASGRPFEAADMRGSSKVALIGATVAKEVFGAEDPVGAQIRVKGVPFKVIGVLSAKGQSAFGRDQDDIVLLPMAVARGRIVGKSQVQNDQVGSIYVKIDPAISLAEAQEEIEDLMRQRRHVRGGEEDNFYVRNMAEFMKARTEVLSTLSYLLAATSAISLIVGGIGIMNIMLVSVTERTREIGLRMAVGGRRRDILLQFLVEAVALCLLGGLIGIVVGVAAATIIATSAEWPVLLSPSVMALAMAAAAATGIFFGFFPARRAAGLSPIDALRSE
ncbi:MAG: ABC transporter permease [Pseudomonadota bacterium]